MSGAASLINAGAVGGVGVEEMNRCAKLLEDLIGNDGNGAVGTIHGDV